MNRALLFHGNSPQAPALPSLQVFFELLSAIWPLQILFVQEALGDRSHKVDVATAWETPGAVEKRHGERRIGHDGAPDSSSDTGKPVS